MLTRAWTTFTTTVSRKPWIRTAFWLIFYLAVIAGLIALYGKGDFSTPSFIYQGF